MLIKFVIVQGVLGEQFKMRRPDGELLKLRSRHGPHAATAAGAGVTLSAAWLLTSSWALCTIACVDDGKRSRAITEPDSTSL
jgi:hypothetical protein